jgi:hypothetical protein
MAAAYDKAREELVVFGGYAAVGEQNIYYGDTWTWNGVTWTQRHPVASPPPGYGANMAYDEARQQVVLFGGTNDHNTSNETWMWDGANWTRETPLSHPSWEYGGAMVYDPVLREVILLRGQDGARESTWAWDGANWTKLHPDHLPPARIFSASAFDQANGTFLVYGGAYDCGDLFCHVGDTWVWDGLAWTKQHPDTLPGPRASAAGAYDPLHEQVLMFGGLGHSGYFDDTWIWDGTNWTRQRPPMKPESREGAALVFDSAKGTVVLFGGFAYGDPQNHAFNDLWSWDGVTWTQL